MKNDSNVGFKTITAAELMEKTYHLAQLIDQATSICGNQRDLAARLGYSPAAVTRWKQRDLVNDRVLRGLYEIVQPDELQRQAIEREIAERRIENIERGALVRVQNLKRRAAMAQEGNG